MTVITHLDELEDESGKEKAFDLASWATGSSSERTYLIANYTYQRNEKSFVVERTALDILDFALLSAERFIRIKKQREKNQMEREIAAGGKTRMIVDQQSTLTRVATHLEKRRVDDSACMRFKPFEKATTPVLVCSVLLKRLLSFRHKEDVSLLCHQTS